MPIKKITTLSDFRGGLNTAKHRSLLSDGEFSTLTNLYLLGGKLKQRPPVVVWPVLDSGAALMTGVTGLLALRTAAGVWTLVALNVAGLTKVILGGTSVALVDAMSLSLGSSNAPWRVIQYKDYGYAVRPDLTDIIRFDVTNFWSTGIAAPSTNAAIAQSATAGVVETGNYYGVYTFVDAAGVESAPSPVSTVLAQGASKKIDWSSVDVSTNPRVTARNLYRTLTNQEGEYFFVHQIADNTSTTATENTTIPEMGSLAPVDNVVPPSKNWVDIARQFERVWVTDGSMVYGSAAEDPDSFPPANVYAFSPDDGQPIVALARLNSDLIILKSGSVWALGQTLGAFEFVPRTLDESNGCSAVNSVAVADDLVFWFSGTAIFASDGRSKSRDLTTGRIAFFSGITDAFKAGVVGSVYSALGWYVVSAPDYSSDIYVYDYRRDYWFTTAITQDLLDPVNGWFTANYPTFFTEVLDAYGVPHLFASFYPLSGSPQAALFDMFVPANAGNGDLGGVSGYEFGTFVAPVTRTVVTKIPTRVVFKELNFGSPGSAGAVSRILVLMEAGGSISGGLTAILLAATTGAFGIFKSRSNIAISNRAGWKNLSLSSRTRHLDGIQLDLRRTDNIEIDIAALQFHVEVWLANLKEGT